MDNNDYEKIGKAFALALQEGFILNGLRAYENDVESIEELLEWYESATGSEDAE